HTPSSPTITPIPTYPLPRRTSPTPHNDLGRHQKVQTHFQKTLLKSAAWLPHHQAEKASLISQNKIKHKRTKGLTGKTEKMLAAKAGHLEMLKGGKREKRIEKEGVKKA
ncbi:hypothetical protein BU26DRAFT_77616, partial [Trematosphaeria pertusa]